MSLYFQTPDEWQKAFPILEDREAAFAQIDFHNKAITRVKKSLGKKCTYLAHQREGDVYSFVAYLLIKGKRIKVNVTDGVPSVGELKAEHYKKLKGALDGYRGN